MSSPRIMGGIMKILRLICSIAVLGSLAVSAATALPLAVGHRSITYVDPARNNRQVQTELYYPADAAGDNVPVAAGAYPVVTFGHGFLMSWSAYQYLWTSLAPQGYILAFARTEGGALPNHEQFGRDLAFLVDQLRAEGAGASSPFYQHVGPTACVMGHSMGGGASVLAASYNPGITALANLAAAETSPSAVGAAANVTVPSLMFAGSRDCVTPPAQHQIPIYNALASDCKALVTIAGGNHCQFAESGTLCEFGESCSAEITRERQHALVLALLTPWLSWTLKADPAGLQQFEALLDLGDGITSVEDCPLASDVAESGVPAGLGVTVGPNPFSRSTHIRVDAIAGLPTRVEIFDAAGRKVRSLAEGPAHASPLLLSWDGRDDRGGELPRGTYFCTVRDGSRASSRSLVFLR
jgi:predicted dienelactone hydrolase